MKNNVAYVFLALLLGFSAGCKSTMLSAMRPDPEPVSDFLPNHELLERQPDTFPYQWFYLSAKPGTYKNVYVAPVDFTRIRKSSKWAEFNTEMNGKVGGDMAFLVNFMRQAYVQAFQKAEATTGLKVVDSPDQPDTLVVELSLIRMVPTKAETVVVGQVLSFVMPIIGGTIVWLSGGNIDVECRLIDGRSGKVVGMYANREDDPAAIFPVAQLTWTRSARINMKDMASYLVKVLSARDWREVERDYPIRIITRIIDANLDDPKK